MKKKLSLLSSSIILSLAPAACSSTDDVRQAIVVEEPTANIVIKTIDVDTTTPVANFEVDEASEAYFDKTVYPALTITTENYDATWQEYRDSTFLSTTESTTFDQLIEPMEEDEIAFQEVISPFEAIPVKNLLTEAQDNINASNEKFIDFTNKRIKAFQFLKKNLEDEVQE